MCFLSGAYHVYFRMDPIQTREKLQEGDEVNTAAGDPFEDVITIFVDSQARGYASDSSAKGRAGPAKKRAVV